MLKAQLDRVHTIVGRITTEFSEIELLWYLIFTCLLGSTPRTAVDAIFNNLKTGAQQRQMMLDVATAILDNKSDLYKSIKERVEQTKILAGRRNDAVHSIIQIFEAAIPPYIAAGGISKPSRINAIEIDSEIVEIYRAMLFHRLDMHELRLEAIRYANPQMNLSREERQLVCVRQEVQQNLASDPILQSLLQQPKPPPQPSEG